MGGHIINAHRICSTLFGPRFRIGFPFESGTQTGPIEQGPSKSEDRSEMAGSLRPPDLRALRRSPALHLRTQGPQRGRRANGKGPIRPRPARRDEDVTPSTEGVIAIATEQMQRPQGRCRVTHRTCSCLPTGRQECEANPPRTRPANRRGGRPPRPTGRGGGLANRQGQREG